MAVHQELLVAGDIAPALDGEHGGVEHDQVVAAEVVGEPLGRHERAGNGHDSTLSGCRSGVECPCNGA